METLIELYDDRAIENILAADLLRPRRIVYLCPAHVPEEQFLSNITNFFHGRGWDPEVHFVKTDVYSAGQVHRELTDLRSRYPDCVIDVTGGTDAALFAAGMASGSDGIPAFTYSRQKNKFFEILNVPGIDGLPCSLRYSVEDMFRIAGGTLHKGRVDNRLLKDYLPLIGRFMEVFLRFRQPWPHIITYFQKVSPTDRSGEQALRITAPRTVKGDHAGAASADPEALLALRDAGLLKDVQIGEDSVSFSFADPQCRIWLRDVGSVLELFIYKVCLESGLFNDLVSSAVVDWDDLSGAARVTNEIDLMAVRGIVPLFVSCKTCAVSTEALNELAILRDRFGGKGGKAVIVTSEPCGSAARHRAAQMGIAVIDPEELESQRLLRRLRIIMKVEA